MQYVKGKVVIEMDSDDTFLPNAFKTICEDYKNIGNRNVYGMIYKMNIINGKDIDTNGINNSVIKLFDIHNKYSFDFDMKLVFITKERKKYKYNNTFACVRVIQARK